MGHNPKDLRSTKGKLVAGQLTLEGDAYGIWVSGVRGHWMPDPLSPLETYRSLDLEKAKQIAVAYNCNSDAESFQVIVIRKDEC